MRLEVVNLNLATVHMYLRLTCVFLAVHRNSVHFDPCLIHRAGHQKVSPEVHARIRPITDCKGSELR